MDIQNFNNIFLYLKRLYTYIGIVIYNYNIYFEDLVFQLLIRFNISCVLM